MPFQKGNQLGKLAENPGRRVYELEQAQLEKMRRILNKDLKMMERLQDAEELNPLEEKKLAILEGRIKKFADKLHVSKTATDITTKGESVNINPETLKLAQEFEKKLNEQEDGKIRINIDTNNEPRESKYPGMDIKQSDKN